MKLSLSCWLLYVLLLHVRVDSVSSLLPSQDIRASQSVKEQDHRLAETSNCPLKCQNGASCIKKAPGRRLVTDKEDDNSRTHNEEDEWECLCLNDFTGRLCESRRDSLRHLTDSCALDCQNNGKCPQISQNSLYALCDCSSAFVVVAGFASNVNFQRYVGKTCQTQVLEEDYCAGNSDLFCVNNGTCRQTAIDFGTRPCKCPTGFTGRHCEYAVGEVQENCFLTCSNVGRCQYGSNPNTGANALIEISSQGLQYMYCVCDQGFAGVNCEYSVTDCGQNKYCFNGSKCPNASSNETQCQCDLSGSTKSAGDLCQYKATDDCTSPRRATTYHDMADKMGSDDVPFCVNQGVCVKENDLDSFYFCECDETNWTGMRCEVRVQVEEDSTFAPTSYLTPQPTSRAPVTGKPSSYPTRGKKPTKAPVAIPPPTLPLPPPTLPLSPPTLPPQPIRTEESNANSAPTPSLNGTAKVGIVMLSLAVAFTLAIAIYRYRRRLLRGKDFDAPVAAPDGVIKESNLHDETSSEESFVVTTASSNAIV